MYFLAYLTSFRQVIIKESLSRIHDHFSNSDNSQRTIAAYVDYNMGHL